MYSTRSSNYLAKVQISPTYLQAVKSLACCAPGMEKLCLQLFSYKSVSNVTFKWPDKLWDCIHGKGPFFTGFFDWSNGWFSQAESCRLCFAAPLLCTTAICFQRCTGQPCVSMRKIQILSPYIFLIAFLSDTGKFRFLLKKIPPAHSINLTRKFTSTLENVNTL